MMSADEGETAYGVAFQTAALQARSAHIDAWVRDADRELNTLDDHRIATRLLDGANSTVVPANLPDSIVEFSLAVDGDGAPHLAFTRAEDGGGLVDTRHNLYSAAYGGSAWSYDRLLDTYGRPIRAEGPILTLDKYDQGTVTFRGLGFGPTPPMTST